MSFHVSLDSLEEIHRCLMQTLVEDPDCESAPRGKPIKELVAASFTLMNPRDRLIVSPAREVNYGFAVGELCWYLRGDTDLATMAYYNRRMSQFSDDGKTINSAYGHRMFKQRWNGESQLTNVLNELRHDPDSRRAVMHINEPWDLRKAQLYDGPPPDGKRRGSKDVPCTMSLQLLIRDRKLHMHVLMRSNDVVWGLPYDVFSFTCLMESFLYVLQEGGVPVDDLGCYHHTAGSLHLYETHYGMAGLVSKEEHPSPAPMNPFTLEALEYLSEVVEPAIRRSFYEGSEDESRGYLEPDDPDDSTIDWMGRRLVRHRRKRLEEAKEKNEQA